MLLDPAPRDTEGAQDRSHRGLDLSAPICWTRMQTEAGQPLSEIIRRKELERAACGGVFFWGVGNAPSRWVLTLSASNVEVPVIFSTMRSRPQPKDISPSGLSVWRHFALPDGSIRPLPPGALVTSRSKVGHSRSHYALMCKSTIPLQIGRYGQFDPSLYRNFGSNGKRIGPSQVTCLVERGNGGRSLAQVYEINLRARLVGGYWVRLVDPVNISGSLLRGFCSEISQENLTEADWIRIVNYWRSRPTNPSRSPYQQLSLM